MFTFTKETKKRLSLSCYNKTDLCYQLQSPISVPTPILLKVSSCPHIQAGLIITFCLSVAVTVLSVINVGNSIVFAMTPPLLATSSLMPLAGFLLGYILSALFQLNPR